MIDWRHCTSEDVNEIAKYYGAVLSQRSLPSLRGRARRKVETGKMLTISPICPVCGKENEDGELIPLGEAAKATMQDAQGQQEYLHILPEGSYRLNYKDCGHSVERLGSDLKGNTE